VFNQALADKAIEWFPKYLKHTKGKWAGVPFELLDWQKNIIGKLFGTVKEDGTRQYTTVYVEIPKKQGKSELAAGVALRLLFADHEPGAEIYGAAADRDQASIVFNVAADMVRQSPALGKRCKIIDSTKRIVHNNGGVYRVLSSDSHTKHGFNTHGVIFDELHTQPNRTLYDVLTQGSGDARSQPVYFNITTAGYDRHSICWELHEYAVRVLADPSIDPTFLPVLYFAEDDDDWTDEKVWAKCNPSLGITVDISKVREACNRAKEVPALENSFRQLRLNQWVKQAVRFLPMRDWDACPPHEDLDFEGETFYGGLDLASVSDIAALVLVRQNDDGMVDVLPFFWIPEESARLHGRTDKVDYERWIKEGFIFATPGNRIDYKYIRAKINELATTYHIAEIAYDRWNSDQVVLELIEDGANMIDMGQGFQSMNSPTKALLSKVLGHEIRHNGNPVLRWMADNAVVKRDPAGNMKPDKEKSTQKIDGIVALIMALDRAIRHEKDGPSIYETEELLIL
jgi:phage terminase large subunit-like protein